MIEATDHVVRHKQNADIAARLEEVAEVFEAQLAKTIVDNDQRFDVQLEKAEGAF